MGYILTKRFREQDPLLETMANVGWIDAVLVDPDWQRRGIGRDLMTWAMYSLRSEGAGKIFLGGGFGHFLPGVPQESPIWQRSLPAGGSSTAAPCGICAATCGDSALHHRPRRPWRRRAPS